MIPSSTITFNTFNTSVWHEAIRLIYDGEPGYALNAVSFVAAVGFEIREVLELLVHLNTTEASLSWGHGAWVLPWRLCSHIPRRHFEIYRVPIFDTELNIQMANMFPLLAQHVVYGHTIGT